MALDIVGGCYEEVCIEPIWNELYGSGLRAAHALSQYGQKITFHTCIGHNDYDNLACISASIGVDLVASIVESTSLFKYYHPLANPEFYIPQNTSESFSANADYVLQFGMIEGSYIINAKKVVYDPQSPGAPQSFWSNGSKTNELIWVTNLQEAKLFTGCSNIEDIKNYLFDTEKVHAAIIKQGTDGAILIQKHIDDFVIPAFKTKTVWPIGTGDIFSATFAYHYLVNNHSLEESALKASLATAYYSETTCLPLPLDISASNYKEFLKKTSERKKVYLAGPFFTMSQRWLINELRAQLRNFGLDVFSPFHDVGMGKAEIVVPLDIEGIKNSDIIVAIVDGIDAGTLFEIGYATALKIPVMVFSQNEKDESLTMLKGTGSIIENDFSSLIYKTVWEVYK